MKVGDAVYDLIYGDGRVKSITADHHAVVVFGLSSYTYNAQGVGLNKRRTLYWYNPILFSPAKDEKDWGLQQRLNRAIALKWSNGILYAMTDGCLYAIAETAEKHDTRKMHRFTQSMHEVRGADFLPYRWRSKLNVAQGMMTLHRQR